MDGGGGMGHDHGMGGMNMSPPPSSSASGMMLGGMHHMGGMHMTFFWGTRTQILFSGWPGDQGLGMYILALFVVLVASVLLEFLSALARRLAKPNDATTTPAALSLTLLHAVRMGLAYLVMLASMSFNVGVLLAIIAGHAVGFFFAASGLFKCSRANETNGIQPTNTNAKV